MEVLLYFGLPTKNEHDDFSRPQKFIAYPQPHEILKCRFIISIFKRPHERSFTTSLLFQNVQVQRRMFLASELQLDQRSSVDFHAYLSQSSQILHQQS